MSQPTNRQMIASLGLAAATFAVLPSMGFVKGQQALVPGTSIELPAEFAKILWTILAAFLPGLLNKWVPGLGDWVKKLFDQLLKGGDQISSDTPKPGEQIDLLLRAVEPIRGDSEAEQAIEDLVCRLLKCKKDGDHTHEV